MKRLVALAALLAMVLVGCGGKDDKTDPLAGGDAGGMEHNHGDEAAPATCSPSGTSLTISAKDIAFDKACLAAPADQAFTIKFDNNDALPHNVTIQESHTATTSFFSGEQITGPNKSVTYQVPALKAGTFHFHCIVHPDQMNGTFVVK